MRSEKLLILKVHNEIAKFSGMSVYDVQVVLFKNGHGRVNYLYSDRKGGEYKQFHWRWDPKWETIVTKPQEPGSLDSTVLQYLVEAYRKAILMSFTESGSAFEMTVS